MAEDMGALGLLHRAGCVQARGDAASPRRLVLLLTTVALFLLVRLLDSGRWGLVSGLLLGLALGAAQLVRSVGLWIYAVAALALVVAIVVARRDSRRRVAATASVALVLGALLPLPWYVYLQVEYGDPVFGGRPEIRQGSSPRGVVASPALWRPPPTEPRASRASLTFFHAHGSPGIDHASLPGRARAGSGAGRPRRHVGRLLRTVAVGHPGRDARPSQPAEAHAADARRTTADACHRERARRLVALVARSPRRRIAQLPIPALALVGLASLALYAWRYPSPDGDTVKALFLLPAVPAFAVAFGFAVDVARTHLPLAVRAGLGVLLVVALALCAEFGVA